MAILGREVVGKPVGIKPDVPVFGSLVLFNQLQYIIRYPVASFVSPAIGLKFIEGGVIYRKIHLGRIAVDIPKYDGKVMYRSVSNIQNAPRLAIVKPHLVTIVYIKFVISSPGLCHLLVIGMYQKISGIAESKGFNVMTEDEFPILVEFNTRYAIPVVGVVLTVIGVDLYPNFTPKVNRLF